MIVNLDPTRLAHLSIPALKAREHALCQALTDWANLDENMHRPPSEWPLCEDWDEAFLALHFAQERER